MVEVRLRPSAEKDFIDIGTYQIGEWPLAERKLREVRAGYHCRRSGSHLIFYIVKLDGQVEIVRILHEKVDIRRHLDEQQ